jgi:hypothetical protein
MDILLPRLMSTRKVFGLTLGATITTLLLAAHIDVCAGAFLVPAVFGLYWGAILAKRLHRDMNLAAHASAVPAPQPVEERHQVGVFLPPSGPRNQ